jgi:signal recognition particle subunit SRP54
VLENLTARLARIVKRIRGEARLTEANIEEALREVRVALLEADVALPVVKEFVAAVRARALGQEVLASLSPGQALVGVVHRELVRMLGETNVPLALAVEPPAVILLAGLQGSGKTTTAGKLALHLRGQKKKVLLVSCDVYRPAAIEQLRTVAAQAGADFYPSAAGDRPLEIARSAREHARLRYYDVLIADSAGRLAVDAEMMREIAELHRTLAPAETLLVVDAMQGQDALRSARAFAEALPLTGIILTKLDGDARGGAALSVRAVTGKPVKFAGVGEKLTGLEAFHPERMAARILGMGDIVSLVEQAQREADVESAKRVAEKLRKGKGFDLGDFRAQIEQMRKMGGLAALADKLPAELLRQVDPARLQDERQFRRLAGIIDAMTPAERAHPELIKASRKRRIAAGAGVAVQEVNRLLRQFEQMQEMMKRMKGGNLQRMLRGMKGVLPGSR